MKPRYGLIAGLVCAAVAAGLLVLWRQFPGIADENALLENLQGGLFVLGAVWALAATVTRGESRRFSGWFFALLLTSMVLREIDMDRIGLPEWIALLTSGTGRNIIMGVLWLLFTALALRYRHRARNEIAVALRSAWGRQLLAGALLYVVGALFDKKVLSLPRATGLFCEELAETLGALLIVSSVVLWSRLAAGRDRQG